MTPLVPIMLFGWVPFTCLLCFRYLNYRAILLSVIGGTLFLPYTGYNLPGLPRFDRSSAIALGLIIGLRLSGMRANVQFRWRLYDLPVLIFCLVPLFSSLNNGFGVYEGLSGIYSRTMEYGTFYLAGRMYFSSDISLQGLCRGIVIGGLLYMPLCWYEIRMSPQLSNIFYGFFPHSFAQQFRYGGFRPVVFMYHGLMVALWMALCTVLAYWFWRDGRWRSIKGIPMSILVFLLALTTVLCKSANGWFALLLGCVSFTLYRLFSVRIILVFLLLVLSYPALRISGLVSETEITGVVSHVLDSTRVGSLGIRLRQEDLFVENILKRPLLGWGRIGRAWPRREDEKKAIDMVDSLWLIYFAVNGFTGLISFYAMLLLGPWLVYRNGKRKIWRREARLPAVALSFLVLLFAVDSYVNGMPLPVYFLAAGSLVGYSLRIGVQGQTQEVKTRNALSAT